MSLRIRLATAADALAIASVHTDSWRSAYRDILRDAYLDGPIAAERLAHWETRLSLDAWDTSQFVALAELDGAPTGFVCVVLDADPTWGALLDNLHVSPSLKSQGQGRRLMAEGARWVLQHRPQSRLHLWVYERNVPARGFYEHLDGVVTLRDLRSAPDGSRVAALRYGWADLRGLAAVAGSERAD